jgi:serine/threonine-protein kinase HipA
MELLLQHSSEPMGDRRTFFSACVLSWLLAAPDAHAKNYSVSLQPQGRVRLTPLYDLLSAHPLVARKQLAPQKLKMAMAVRGKNRHDRWEQIQRRHWLETAKRCRFPEREAVAVLDSMAERIDDVIARTHEQIPAGFPDDVATPVLDGLAGMRARLTK